MMNNQAEVAKSVKKYRRLKAEADGLCLYKSLNLQLKAMIFGLMGLVMSGNCQRIKRNTSTMKRQLS